MNTCDANCKVASDYCLAKHSVTVLTVIQEIHLCLAQLGAFNHLVMATQVPCRVRIVIPPQPLLPHPDAPPPPTRKPLLPHGDQHIMVQKWVHACRVVQL